jgi:hypothetical protein
LVLRDETLSAIKARLEWSGGLGRLEEQGVSRERAEDEPRGLPYLSQHWEERSRIFARHYLVISMIAIYAPISIRLVGVNEA